MGTEGKQLSSPRRAAPFASCGRVSHACRAKAEVAESEGAGEGCTPGDKFGKCSLWAFLLASMAADENKVVLNYWESIFFLKAT